MLISFSLDLALHKANARLGLPADVLLGKLNKDVSFALREARSPK
jgi:hypothetical protein